jgi:hypothetical protein
MLKLFVASELFESVWRIGWGGGWRDLRLFIGTEIFFHSRRRTVLYLPLFPQNASFVKRSGPM